MQGVALIKSRSHTVGSSAKRIELPEESENVYRTLEQEVDLGVQALQQGSAEMAVTFFQSALQKLAVDQPLYDHLVHNLLQSYKLLIEQLLREGDKSLARDFLRAALRLDIQGEMAQDS